MRRNAIFDRHLPLLVLACTLPLANTRAHAQSTLPAFPEPDKIFESAKKFNAVTLGPGNTFTVSEVSPDLELEALDFSTDDKLLYLEWKSGRLETRDLESGKQITQSKPISGPLWEVVNNEAQKQLLLVTEHGVIRFVNPFGKKVREIVVEKGRSNYDIQKVLLAPDGSWLAYVNQDNGKILDLRGDTPKVLADLGDAYDIVLSPDKTVLWVINRGELFGFAVSTWQPTARTKLLDQVSLTQTPTLAVLSGESGLTAFVPSKSGLLRYDLSTMSGQRVTTTPTYWVGADREHNQVYVREYKASAIYDSKGSAKCHWQLRPAQDFKVSPSGRWLGYRNLGKAELWSTDKLLQACPAATQ